MKEKLRVRNTSYKSVLFTFQNCFYIKYGIKSTIYTVFPNHWCTDYFRLIPPKVISLKNVSQFCDKQDLNLSSWKKSTVIVASGLNTVLQFCLHIFKLLKLASYNFN